MSTRPRLIGLIGNILEHYDNALFGLLAPFIASYFFEKSDPVTALILTYGMLPLGIFFRPLGSLFFGWIGDRFGRKKALCYSLIGMAIVTVCMGCLPTYASVGIMAPALLAFCRILQNFCAAGENIGGAIFILEHTQPSRRSFISSIYNASTIAGMLIASVFVTICSIYFKDMDFWRWLYWSGGVTALIALPIRFKLSESPEFLASTAQVRLKLGEIVRKYYKPLLAIICVAGFSYTTYSLPFTLMHGFIPLVSNISKADVAQATTFLILLDMCTLPLFGLLAERFSKERVMFISACIAFFTSIPLFYLLTLPSVAITIFIRVVIVMCGVAFSAGYYAWTQELVPPQYRYTILSLGYAIGSQLIGAPSCAVSLWLFKKTGWMGAPALYLMVTSFLAGFILYRYAQTKRQIAAVPP